VRGERGALRPTALSSAALTPGPWLQPSGWCPPYGPSWPWQLPCRTQCGGSKLSPAQNHTQHAGMSTGGPTQAGDRQPPAAHTAHNPHALACDTVGTPPRRTTGELQLLQLLQACDSRRTNIRDLCNRDAMCSLLATMPTTQFSVKDTQASPMRRADCRGERGKAGAGWGGGEVTQENRRWRERPTAKPSPAGSC
jgi:hypothetical protein